MERDLHAAGGGGVMTTLYLWLRPGAAPPAGYRPTGVISVWPDTGKVRAELWERTE